MVRWLWCNSYGGKRAVLAVLVLFVGLLLWVDAARADVTSDPITLEVSSAAIALPPAGQGLRQVLVVARNRGSADAQNLRLSWMSDANVDLAAPDPEIAQLPAGAAHAWALTITRNNQSALTGTVLLRLDYTALIGGKSVVYVALATLRIDAASITPLTQVVDIQSRSTTGVLDERHSGAVYLVLTNTASVSITVGPVVVDPIARLSASNVISINVDPLTPITLEPRMTSAVLVHLSTSATVQPGTYLVVFHVPISWQEHGQPQKGTALVTHEISIGVVGESAILTVLGIPSLFFLPGFLAVVMAGMVWRIGRPPEATFALRAPAPEFWVAAISLSFLIGVSYGWITGRNLLDGYGLTDIVWLWVVSLLLGAIGVYPTIGLLRLFDRLRHSAIQRWINRMRPTGDDQPEEVLEKLARQKRGPYLEQVNWTEGGQQRIGYLLEPWLPERAMHWVGPEMVISWSPGTSSTVQRQIRQAVSQGQTGELAQLLVQGKKARQLTVDWQRNQTPDRPVQVATTALTRYGPQLIISGT